MSKNPLGARLQADRPLFGLFSCSYSLQATEAISESGYDFLIFDTEHCPGSLTTLHGQLIAAAGAGVSSVVRLQGLFLPQIKLCLDLGADALMVPNIDTAEQARTAVKFCRYAPEGRRGVAGTVRATRYGRDKFTLSEANQRSYLIVQAESKLALHSIRDIAEVEGIDAVFFGPHDLAADMGHFGNPGHTEVVEAIIAGIAEVRAAGKVAGVLASEKECGRYFDAGVGMAALGSELGLMVAGADGLLKRVSAAFGAAQA